MKVDAKPLFRAAKRIGNTSDIQNSLQQTKRMLNTVHPLFILLIIDGNFRTTENKAGIVMKKMLEALIEFIYTKLNMQDTEDVPDLIIDEAFTVMYTSTKSSSISLVSWQYNLDEYSPGHAILRQMKMISYSGLLMFIVCILGEA